MSILGDQVITAVSDDLLIISIIAQQYFGRDGERYTSYDALDKGFYAVSNFIKQADLTDIQVHHQKIGAGLGGGDWGVIEAIIQSHLPNTHLWVL